MISLPTLLLAVLTSAAPTKSNLVVALCDAGEHQQFETVTCDVELRNSSDKPIRVFDAQALSHWDTIQAEAIVPAHGVAYLKATVGVNDSVGYSHRLFRFATDELGEGAKRQAQVQLFADTVLDQNAPAIDMGTVRLNNLPPAKSITLTSREVPDFRILSVLAKPDYVEASLDKDGRTVRVSIGKNAPWGIVHEKIKLKINAPQQPEAWIAVDANIQGDVIPDNNPVLLGLMRTNKKNEFLIRLTSRTYNDFKIGALGLEGIKGSAKAGPCKPEADGCKLLSVLISNDQMQGRVGGTLSVELPDFKRTLPIRLGGGMLLSPDVVIHDIKTENEKAREAAGVAKSTVVAPAKSKEIDVKQAIKQTIAKENDVPPPGTGPLLRWGVANQNFVFGYVIYRADAERGPFLRVNKATIKTAANDGAQSGTYQWRDNSAVPGKTYWYSIGMVKEDGEKVTLSTAQKVVAK